MTEVVTPNEDVPVTHVIVASADSIDEQDIFRHIRNFNKMIDECRGIVHEFREYWLRVKRGSMHVKALSKADFWLLELHCAIQKDVKALARALEKTKFMEILLALKRPKVNASKNSLTKNRFKQEQQKMSNSLIEIILALVHLSQFHPEYELPKMFDLSDEDFVKRWEERIEELEQVDPDSLVDTDALYVKNFPKDEDD